MKSRSLVWMVPVFCLVVVLAATTASAGMISYNANADPAGETYDGYPTESGITPWTSTGGSGTGVDDGGTPAWLVTDGVDNGWTLNATSADVALSESNGYTLTARFRVSSGDSSAYVHQVIFNDTVNFLSGGFQMRPDPNSHDGDAGDVLVNVNGNEYINVGGENAYSTYKLVCSPAAGTMDFYVDSSLIFSDVPLVDNSTWWGGSPPPSYVMWGDNTGSSNRGGNICYNSVEWTTIPEPGALAIMVTGMLGLLAYAWRRRK